MRSYRAALTAGSLLTPVLVIGALLAQAPAAVAAGPPGGHARALYVSKHASPSAADTSCKTAAFTTIGSALKAAPRRGTVVVCPGTYHEQVAITKPVSLVGRHAVINERGVTPTFSVNVPGVGKLTIFAGVVIVSSHVSVHGFAVKNALGEGILAAGVTGTIRDIAISRNAVLHNDLGGGVPPVSSYFECQPAGEIPGDCGEGIHFLSVANSHISRNLVAHNSGGILLTDETGPNHNNVIEHNIITRNPFDCGITVPGHNPAALNSAGKRQPAVAGVYHNVIRHNVITKNGLKGEGAGVLFANAGPGTASYGNLVKDNYIAGNDLSGVTFHAHTLGPGQFEDLSGNKVIGNAIGRNNLGGDPLDSPVSPEDLKTTGVLVFSGGIAVHAVIAHNRIFNNSIGIWLSKPVKASGLPSNSFHHVTTPISAGN